MLNFGLKIVKIVVFAVAQSVNYNLMKRVLFQPKKYYPAK